MFSGDEYISEIGVGCPRRASHTNYELYKNGCSLVSAPYPYKVYDCDTDETYFETSGSVIFKEYKSACNNYGDCYDHVIGGSPYYCVDGMANTTGESATSSYPNEISGTVYDSPNGSSRWIEPQWGTQWDSGSCGDRDGKTCNTYLGSTTSNGHTYKVYQCDETV